MANLAALEGMPGAGLTFRRSGQAGSERLILKPYWGKPAVRNFRGGDGDVGIMRSPVRAIALPDCLCLPRAGGGQPLHPIYLRVFKASSTYRRS